MSKPAFQAAGRMAVMAAVLAVSFAGCAPMGPNYQRPDVPLPKAWRGEQVDAADVVDTAWWEAFGDADLSALVKAAIDANKDLLIATYKVEQFSAKLAVSKAASYPQLGYNLGRSRHVRSEEQPALLAVTREPDYNNYELNLTLAWEIDIWGRIARANDAARAELLSSEEARRAVMLQVVTNVADGYVQLLARDRQLAFARQVLANRQQAAALLDAKFKGGSATEIEAKKAVAAVDEAQAAIAPIERDIARTENALAALLGRNPGPVQRRSLEVLKLPPVPAGLPSDLLLRRPDVVAAEQTLVAANAMIGVAKGAYFPTVSLTGALGLASDHLRWLNSRDARQWNLGAGLVGTLFSAGRIESDIRAAEAVRKQMAETYLQSVQTALREVEDALVSRGKAGEQVAALRRYVQSLQEVSQLTRQRYEGGQSTYLDVLDAERQLLAAQDRQTQGLRDQYSALVSVYKAMGGGWMVEQDKSRSPPPAAEGAASADAQQTGMARGTEIRQ